MASTPMSRSPHMQYLIWHWVLTYLATSHSVSKDDAEGGGGPCKWRTPQLLVIGLHTWLSGLHLAELGSHLSRHLHLSTHLQA